MTRKASTLLSVFFFVFVGTGSFGFAFSRQVSGKCEPRYSVVEQEFYCRQSTCNASCLLSINPEPGNLGALCSCG